MALTYKAVGMADDGSVFLWQCVETGAYVTDPVKAQAYDTSLTKASSEVACPNCKAQTTDLTAHLAWHTLFKV